MRSGFVGPRLGPKDGTVYNGKAGNMVASSGRGKWLLIALLLVGVKPVVSMGKEAEPPGGAEREAYAFSVVSRVFALEAEEELPLILITSSTYLQSDPSAAVHLAIFPSGNVYAGDAQPRVSPKPWKVDEATPFNPPPWPVPVGNHDAYLKGTLTSAQLSEVKDRLLNDEAFESLVTGQRGRASLFWVDFIVQTDEGWIRKFIDVGLEPRSEENLKQREQLEEFEGWVRELVGSFEEYEAFRFGMERTDRDSRRSRMESLAIDGNRYRSAYSVAPFFPSDLMLDHVPVFAHTFHLGELSAPGGAVFPQAVVYEDGTIIWQDLDGGHRGEWFLNTVDSPDVDAFVTLIRNLEYFSSDCFGAARAFPRGSNVAYQSIAFMSEDGALRFSPTVHPNMEASGRMRWQADGSFSLSDADIDADDRWLENEPECYRLFRADWDAAMRALEDLLREDVKQSSQSIGAIDWDNPQSVR